VLHRTTLVAVAALAASCSLSVSYEDSRFACRDGQCPAGFECSDDVCAPPPASATPAADAGAAACDGDDASFDPDTGHCYVLERDLRSWPEAVAGCAERGERWHLAFVRSADENERVARLGHGVVTGFAWIGATDGPSEGDWQWLDGDRFPPGFSAWHEGEPNGGGGSGDEQDCAALSTHDPFLGDWDDTDCDARHPSICETE
jgi:hypothetical protein